ncbi:hypothetical protein mRhiFer1_008730 [Rhinolophus ferrumequinum]|uniref:Ribosomal protein L22 like 1 n=1 Tax=Rhinolophus ferrumequinum TaxID=59479 RepID=A0A7J7TRH4_RHIFE|nr:hypothetical protein mRhiFer1_008730 [Rhinolophus ferrumequinum]
MVAQDPLRVTVFRKRQHFTLRRVFPELLRAEASHKQDYWSGDEFDISCGEVQDLKKQSKRHGFKKKGFFPDGLHHRLEMKPKEKVKVNGKTRNLRTAVHIERCKNKMTDASEKLFSKRYLKYLTKKYLKKNSLHDWLHVVASDRETYELRYFQTSQDEDGSESED